MSYHGDFMSDGEDETRSIAIAPKVTGGAAPNLPALRDKVQDLINKGFNLDEVAREVGIQLDQAQSLIEMIEQDKWRQSSHVQILDEQLSDVQDMVVKARSEYFAHPRSDNAFAYTALVQQSVALMNSLEGRVDTDKQVRDVLEKVVQPLMSDTITTMTNEASQATAALMKLIPDNRKNEVKRVIDDLMSGLGVALKREYFESPERIRAALARGRSKKVKDTGSSGASDKATNKFLQGVVSGKPRS